MADMSMQSNAIRGKYMSDIMDKTMSEIHDDMVTIFGPGAEDAFITKDKLPYFTRDGKEVIASLNFSNPLANYILHIMYQAVYDQAKAVGDGTTTLAVLYTNLYTAIEEAELEVNRRKWDKAVKTLNERIKARSVPMTEESMKNMLLTCTQDIDLTYKIYSKMKDAIMDGAFITINKSNIESDFEVEVHNTPTVKVTQQFTLRPFNQTSDRCVVLHCNGILDIAHDEVLMDLMSHVPQYGTPGNYTPKPNGIVILCNGMTAATRSTLKKLVNFLVSNQIKVEDFNNITIFTLDEYRSYSNDQIEDLSTMITDEKGIGGTVNQLTFESMLYQCFHNSNGDNGIPELETFDCDPHCMEAMKNCFFGQPFPIEYDPMYGIRMHKLLGPVATARYDELRKRIQEEKSEVTKVALQRRLKSMYGQYVDIQVGSALMKDSQKKYELILDATISASEAVESGVLHGNSLIIALQESIKLKEESFDNDMYDIYYTIGDAIINTLRDMIYNVYGEIDELYGIVYEGATIRSEINFDLNRGETLDVAWPMVEDEVELDTQEYTDEDGNTFEVASQIVEPVSIITRMLTNSSVIVDLINARTFHLDTFMQNYL